MERVKRVREKPKEARRDIGRYRQRQRECQDKKRHINRDRQRDKNGDGEKETNREKYIDRVRD